MRTYPKTRIRFPGKLRIRNVPHTFGQSPHSTDLCWVDTLNACLAFILHIRLGLKDVPLVNADHSAFVSRNRMLSGSRQEFGEPAPIIVAGEEYP